MRQDHKRPLVKRKYCPPAPEGGATLFPAADMGWGPVSHCRVEDSGRSPLHRGRGHVGTGVKVLSPRGICAGLLRGFPGRGVVHRAGREPHRAGHTAMCGEAGRQIRGPHGARHTRPPMSTIRKTHNIYRVSDPVRWSPLLLERNTQTTPGPFSFILKPFSPCLLPGS